MISIRVGPGASPIATLVLMLGTGTASLAFQTQRPPTELTLPQFRALVRSQNPRENLPVVLQRADQVFCELLTAQGREAAARQSLDRLSGWAKATRARWEAQGVPALDVERLQLAELRLEAELARYQLERREAAREANSLLHQSPEIPLVALPREIPQPPSDSDSTAGQRPSPDTPAANQDTASQGGLAPGLAYQAQLEQMEEELLPRGRELLAKMYQSYLFGGMTLEALLWQEQQVYRAETQYQDLLTRAEMELATGLEGP